MRKLNTPDVFKAFRVITKSSLKDELQKVIEDLAKNGFDTVEKVGIEGILATIGCLSDEKTEKMFYEVLAGPFEMTAKQVAELDIETMGQMLTELYKENNLKSFFTALSGLMNKKH